MDATSKSLNLMRSVKKLLVDALEPTGVGVSFDRRLTLPDLQSTKTKAWVSVIMGESTPAASFRSPVSRSYIYIHCLTRQDPDNVNLYKLVDTVRGLFEDSGPIPVYDTGSTPWAVVTHANALTSLSIVNDLADQTGHQEVMVVLTYGSC